MEPINKKIETIDKENEVRDEMLTRLEKAQSVLIKKVDDYEQSTTHQRHNCGSE